MQRDCPVAEAGDIDLLVDGREQAVGDQTRATTLIPSEAKELKSMQDWVKTDEHYWTHQLGLIKQRAELKMANQLNKQRMKREEAE
jgi:hypothetical protein